VDVASQLSLGLEIGLGCGYKVADITVSEDIFAYVFILTV